MAGNDHHEGGGGGGGLEALLCNMYLLSESIVAYALSVYNNFYQCILIY